MGEERKAVVIVCKTGRERIKIKKSEVKIANRATRFNFYFFILIYKNGKKIIIRQSKCSWHQAL
jgi:hypothetical protein